MIYKKIFIILSLVSALIINCNPSTKSIAWNSMQEKYSEINNQLHTLQLTELENSYCIPYWVNTKKQIQQLLLNKDSSYSSIYSYIAGTMVRSGWDSMHRYEITYLENCVSSHTKQLLEKNNDVNFFNLPIVCSKYNCTSNTLSHLYYAAKILDQFDQKEIQTIVEFGSGFGNLARIFKNILPQTTIILIDLPELLAIQYYFLTTTLPETKIIFHTDIPEEFENQAINLVPVHFIEKLQINTDLFVSTFALSESTQTIQNIVGQKKFFNAHVCYIVGQLGDPNNMYVHPETIHSYMRKNFNSVYCYPSHLLVENIKAYEMMGSKFN